MIIAATYFERCTTQPGRRFDASFEALARRLSNPRIVESKKELPAVAWATFQGDHRSIATTEAVTALGLDFDDGTSFQALVQAWGNYRAIVHTTHSHRPHAHRARVILPFSRPATATEHGRIWRHVARVTGEAGQSIDPSTKDASRLCFLPGMPRGAEYLFDVTSGAVFDVDQVLAGLPAETPTPAARVLTIPDDSIIATVERARRYLAKCEPAISGQGGHRTAFVVATKLVKGFALPLDVAFELLWTQWNHRCDPPWSERDLRRKVKEAAAAREMAEGALLERGRP